MSFNRLLKFLVFLPFLILGSCSDEPDTSGEERELNFIAAKKKIFFYLSKDESGEAERIFDSLEYKNTKSYDYYFVGGTIKADNGKPKEAIDYFNKALDINETEEAYLNLAQLYRELKDSVKFIATVKRLIELNPNDARYYVEYAAHFASQGIFIIAIENMTKAISLGSINNKPAYYVNRGEFRMAFGDLTGAVADCDSAILLDKGHCMAYIQKTAWYLNSGLFKEAIKSADQGLKSSCDKGHLLFRRGVARFMKDDVLGAKEDISGAADLQNAEAINYIKHNAPYGFRILFPMKYRNAAALDLNYQPVMVTRDSCAKWKLAPTSFSVSIPPVFKVKYKTGNSYCCFTQKDKEGVVIQEIKFLENLSTDEKQSIYEIQGLIIQKEPDFKTTSLKMEIIGSQQYFVLRGLLNFDKYKSPEYKGDYNFTYFILLSKSKNLRGFSWNEISKKSLDQIASKAQASRIINSLSFQQ